MSDPIIWMFAGQGSQYFQMGRSLYENHAVFRETMTRLDHSLEPLLEESLRSVIYGQDAKVSDPFNKLTDTHPALLMVQISLVETLRAEGLPAPDLLVGVSLGEYIATSVAGAISPEQMLAELLRQAWTIESLADPGAMLMVLDDVESFEREAIFAGKAEMAGINFDGCFVVAGKTGDIEQVMLDLKARGIAHQLLPVQFAFHSAHIDGMRTHLCSPSRNIVQQKCNTPVIGASDGTGYPFEAKRRDWWNVMRGPIRLDQTLRAIHQHHPRATYIDCGPAGNLRTACVHCLGPAVRERSFAIMTPHGTDLRNLESLKSYFDRESRLEQESNR